MTGQSCQCLWLAIDVKISQLIHLSKKWHTRTDISTVKAFVLLEIMYIYIAPHVFFLNNSNENANIVTFDQWSSRPLVGMEHISMENIVSVPRDSYTDCPSKQHLYPPFSYCPVINRAEVLGALFVC